MAGCILWNTWKQSLRQRNPKHAKSKTHQLQKSQGPFMVLSKGALARWNYEFFCLAQLQKIMFQWWTITFIIIQVEQRLPIICTSPGGNKMVNCSDSCMCFITPLGNVYIVPFLILPWETGQCRIGDFHCNVEIFLLVHSFIISIKTQKFSANKCDSTRSLVVYQPNHSFYLH